MVFGGLFWGFLVLSGARAQDGNPDFQPSFIYMSGSSVNASLVDSSTDVFSLSVADNETGMLPPEDCSGRDRIGDWSLNVTFEGSRKNVSTVTVLLTRNLHLCIANHTDCCAEPLCVVTALQVSACRNSIVVARLFIQAEIYATVSLGNGTGKGETFDNATIIPNQVYHPLGSCPCNLTAGACDIRCCCDQKHVSTLFLIGSCTLSGLCDRGLGILVPDVSPAAVTGIFRGVTLKDSDLLTSECTPEMKRLFSGSCFSGVFGGDVNPPFDQLCSTQTGIHTPDWFPFLCVQSSLDNTPFLGYFYHGSSTTSEASSFEIPSQPVLEFKPGYRQGDPIVTMSKEYFAVPQPFLAGQCARNAPVAFLRDFAVECLATGEDRWTLLPHAAIYSGTGASIQPLVTYENQTTTGGSCSCHECKNVTFAEHYTIVWEGRGITQVNVSILLGEICSEETLRQRFTVNFVSANATNTEEELSGNPGYQVGKPVRARSFDSSVTTLKLWKPDGRGLCRSAGRAPVLFGLDMISGCLLEVDLKESCSQLRQNVIDRLNSLVQANWVGKRGNSSSSISDDWVKIICLDTFDPDLNTSVGSLKGLCPNVPVQLNIRILTADVGAIEGIPQEEILGVEISFSTITWQVQCPLTCKEDNFLPISAAVQFIKIPAQPPVPKTRYQINYTEFDCKRNDVCWPELFYPLTRYYTGEPYSHSLAKGLVLVFFILIAILLSDPGRRICGAWNKP